MISGVPLVMGDKLFVQSETGALAAFQVRTPEPRPESAEDDAAAEEET
jgi:hypothetical protein